MVAGLFFVAFIVVYLCSKPNLDDLNQYLKKEELKLDESNPMKSRVEDQIIMEDKKSLRPIFSNESVEEDDDNDPLQLWAQSAQDLASLKYLR